MMVLNKTTRSLSFYSIFILLTTLFFSPIAQAKYTLLVEPNDGSAQILQALNNAKKSVDMEMYLITDQDILTALENCAERGVNVRVILEHEPYGMGSTEPEQIKKTLEADPFDIKVHWANEATYKYTHEKAMVIDQKTAVIMTLNQSYSAYHYNREYGIIDTNPGEVQEIEKVFNADWALKSTTENESNLLWSPDNSRTKMESLINSAKKTLQIEAEELFDDAIVQDMLNLAKKGVKITLIMPPQQDTTDIKTLTANRNIKVYILNDGDQHQQLFMHAKLIIADGSRTYLGSENLSYYSLNYNRELGVLLSANESSIIKRLSTTFATDLKNARPFSATKHYTKAIDPDTLELRYWR